MNQTHDLLMQLTYILCLLVILTLRFTCGVRKIWWNIEIFQNTMKMIVGKLYNLRQFIEKTLEESNAVISD